MGILSRSSRHRAKGGVLMFGDQRLPKRFWNKAIESEAGCWEWQAAIHRKGYGQFYSDGQMAQAHRVAYSALVAPIDPERQLDHICHNRKCVNPSHLNPVSNKQNAENREGANVNSRSGIRGVLWDGRTSQWFARVHHNGRSYYGPRTPDISVAERCAIELRNRLYSNNLADRSAA
ncbi:HNH endonuclease [Mycolicibacterium fortuitum]|uniref:HNH endonuclease n=1 Tax=Mycolicibacterium fortuitum TaxID=1766 RepID=UPI003AF8B3DA